MHKHSAEIKLLVVTSAVTLSVFRKAANYSLHRLLQHRRVPGVTVSGGPGPQPHSDPAVQAVELQRGRRRRRPGRSGKRGRGRQKRRNGDRYSGPERGAEGPCRSRNESDSRLQPVRADTVRHNVRFHCPNVTSAKSRSVSNIVDGFRHGNNRKIKKVFVGFFFINRSREKNSTDVDSTHMTAAVHPECGIRLRDCPSNDAFAYPRSLQVQISKVFRVVALLIIYMDFSVNIMFQHGESR